MLTAAHKVGRYEMLRRLAVGGMGEIFLARERGMAGFDRLVVVKKLLPDLARRPEITTMFLDEARIVAHLVHPGIAQVYELGEDGGTPFLAMEYVPGEDLSEIFRCAGPAGVVVPRPLVVYVLAEAARALDFAHHARDVAGAPLGIVHRDVSPQNLMITAHGDVKLMDFGIAKADNRAHRTDVGKIKGKLAYMSPEQLRGDQVDARTDVFGLGVMLWELTLGRRLFAGDNELDTYRRVIEGVVPPPRTVDPAYPAALEAIVMGALARDRERRTPSAGQVESELRGWLAASGQRVDRQELAALMARLFPDAVRGAADAAGSVTATTFVWARTASIRIEVVDAGTPPTVVGRRTPPPPATAAATGRRRWPWVVVAGGLGIAAAAIALLATSRADRAQMPEPAPVPAAATAAPSTGEPPIAAEATPIDPEPIVDAAPPRVAHAKRRSRPEPTGTVRVTPPDVNDDPHPPRPLPAPAVIDPGPGILLVDSQPFGKVSIDGRARERTPYRTSVSAGDHIVAVTLSEGGGTHSARARVEPGKRTKCTATAEVMRCSAPR